MDLEFYLLLQWGLNKNPMGLKLYITVIFVQCTQYYLSKLVRIINTDHIITSDVVSIILVGTSGSGQYTNKTERVTEELKQ